MRRIKQIALILIALAFVALAVDYTLVRAKEKRTAVAIARCGGRRSSLPLWPIGTEYVVSFRRPLTTDELDQLHELNKLRGYVGVVFVNCELSAAEQRDAVEKLPNCHVFLSNGNERIALPHRD
jgi:hypothetical protein